MKADDDLIPSKMSLPRGSVIHIYHNLGVVEMRALTNKLRIGGGGDEEEFGRD